MCAFQVSKLHLGIFAGGRFCPFSESSSFSQLVCVVLFSHAYDIREAVRMFVVLHRFELIISFSSNAAGDGAVLNATGGGALELKAENGAIVIGRRNIHLIMLWNVYRALLAPVMPLGAQSV